MKNLLPRLSCLLLIGCGEKEVLPDKSATDTDSASARQVASPVIEAIASSGPASADLTPLPETITKEFIMGLWDKPHDGRDVIKELANVCAREGVWKVVTTTGPDKNEMIDTSEASMIVKIVDRRFQVWQWSAGEHIEYSFVTYDSDAEKYRWWGLLPDGFIMEWSGRRYLRNLVEWKTVKIPGEGLEMNTRVTLIAEGRKKMEMTGTIKRDDEVVAYRKDEFTWLSELAPGTPVSGRKVIEAPEEAEE